MNPGMPHIPQTKAKDNSKETPHTFAPNNLHSVEVDPPTLSNSNIFT